MKAKKLKKMLSLMMAMSMVASMPTFALAAEGDPAASGGSSGTGKAEFVYNENVFQVKLPVIPSGTDEQGNPIKDTTLDFILDPMGVIESTQDDNAKKTDETGSTLYFANVDEDKNVTYSKTSDAYEIINKSTFDVTVTVDAAIKDGAAAVTVGETKASFVAENELKTGEDATDAQIYLALVSSHDTAGDANEQTQAIGTDYKAQLVFNVKALTDVKDMYEVKYDGENYEYNLKDHEDIAFADATATVQMTGACNDYSADWSKLGGITPRVDVTWSVNPVSTVTDYENKNGPSVPNLDVDVAANANLTIEEFAMPDGATEIATVTYVIGDDEPVTVKSSSTSGYSFKDDVFTLTGKHLATVTTKAQVVTYTVTFDNDATFTFTVTVK